MELKKKIRKQTKYKFKNQTRLVRAKKYEKYRMKKLEFLFTDNKTL